MKIKLLFLLVFLAAGAFFACSSTEPECEDCESGNSSSGGGSGNSSSDGDGGNSSSGGGSGNSSSGGGGGSSSSGEAGGGSWNPFDDSGETLQATPACPSYENPIEIKYNNGSAPEVTGANEDEFSIYGENVTIDLSGAERNLLLSGTAQNGSLKVLNIDKMGLYLNGVNITNNSGPAINIQKGGTKKVTVCLVSGKENYLTGKGIDSQNGEDAKGAFFSEEKLHFTGNGSLEVKSRDKHAIAIDNDIEIDNGKITISEAEGDGIHVNDKIAIRGGVIKITSKGDALQSEGGDSVVISGGKIQAKTTGIKSHGITTEKSTSILGNAIVQINVSGNGSKGIKSDKWMDISGGNIKILASGNRDQNDADTSTAAGIKVDARLEINGGNLTIKSTGSKAKGINVSENIVMSNGAIDIEADDDGIKVKGTLNMTGGSINAVSRYKVDIDGSVQHIKGTINGVTK